MAHTADMTQTDAPDAPERPDHIVDDVGTPKYNRRLSDKILAAFNHAYAVGEFEVATSLREVLARLDKGDDPADENQRRDGTIALSQADLWIEFVEARNDYRVACDAPQSDPIALDCMLEVMKSSYGRWNAF
jgi:hypothetical protein